MKAVWRDGRTGYAAESDDVGDVLGRNETVGRLIERVAKRFVGTCIARRDIVNPSIANRVEVVLVSDRHRPLLAFLTRLTAGGALGTTTQHPAPCGLVVEAHGTYKPSYLSPFPRY